MVRRSGVVMPERCQRAGVVRKVCATSRTYAVDMGRTRDVGRYFEKLTKPGRGGTRGDASPASSDGRSGGFGGRLKDALSRGTKSATETAKKTTGKVRDTARRLPGRSRSGDDVPPEGVVVVEYSPREDGDPDPGEVVWAWVPFEEDPDQGKDRPVVIIGRRATKLVGVPLTTRANDREAQLKIGTGGWDSRRRVSYARIWRLLDVEPESARREGSVLDERRFEQLVAMVDRYYVVRDGRDVNGASVDDRDR